MPKTKPSFLDIKEKMKKKLEELEVKVGGITEITDDQALEFVEGAAEFYDQDIEGFFGIPDYGLHGVFVKTWSEDDIESDTKKKASVTKSRVRWTAKCDKTPTGLLTLWLSEDQYESLDFDEVYLLIGRLNVQYLREGKYLREKPKEGNALEIYDLNVVRVID